MAAVSTVQEEWEVGGAGVLGLAVVPVSCFLSLRYLTLLRTLCPVGVCPLQSLAA